jgi:hypothetical protein
VYQGCRCSHECVPVITCSEKETNNDDDDDERWTQSPDRVSVTARFPVEGEDNRLIDDDC